MGRPVTDLARKSAMDAMAKVLVEMEPRKRIRRTESPAQITPSSSSTGPKDPASAPAPDPPLRPPTPPLRDVANADDLPVMHLDDLHRVRDRVGKKKGGQQKRTPTAESQKSMFQRIMENGGRGWLWCALTTFLMTVALLVVFRPEFVHRDSDISRLCPRVSVNTLSIFILSSVVAVTSILLLGLASFLRSKSHVS